MASITVTDYGQASNAAFLGDFGSREHILPGGAQLDTTAVYNTEGTYVIKINDNAATEGDTTITVDALPVALPDNAVLTFGDVIVTLNGAKAAGQTSLTVDALGGDIPDDAEATYDVSADSNIVPAGTVVGRTAAERASGADFGPAADADDEVYITVADVDLDRTNEVDLVRHGTLIKQNFLPVYTGLSSTLKGKLEAKYQMVLG